MEPVGVGKWTPSILSTAAKSASTRFGGSGEYPSFPAASWPAQARNWTNWASSACLDDWISDCSAMTR